MSLALAIVSGQDRRVVWLGQRRQILEGISWTGGCTTVGNTANFDVIRCENVSIVLVRVTFRKSHCQKSEACAGELM